MYGAASAAGCSALSLLYSLFGQRRESKLMGKFRPDGVEWGGVERGGIFPYTYYMRDACARACART